jgi:hypothetical protein
MKGTFFSADFIRTDNGIKFIELNTDTMDVFGAVTEDGIDYSGLITLLQNESINTIEVIYKPILHQSLVNHLSESISDNASFITTWTEHEEEFGTIYPTAVTDADNKFILRYAYDENAIVDSVYAKHDVNSLAIFNEYTASSDAIPFFVSSSDTHIDTLERKTNTGVYPDVVLKSQWSVSTVEFVKVAAKLTEGSFVTGDNPTHTEVSGSYYPLSTMVGTHRLVSGSFITPTDEAPATHILLNGRYEPIMWYDSEADDYNPNPDLVATHIFVDGTYETNSTHDEARINAFVTSSELDSHCYYTNFQYGTGSIIDNHVTSIRHYGIVYGSSLTHLSLGTVGGKSLLELPTDSQVDFGDLVDNYYYNRKHYHEFSTSYIKENSRKRGVFETENVVSSSNEVVDIKDIVSGSVVKAFYIPGITDDEDLYSHFINVSVAGNTLPVNTAYTQSVVVSEPSTIDMWNNMIYELRVSGSVESNFMSTDTNALLYVSSSNEFRFKNVTEIVPGNDFLFNVDSSLIPILTSSVHILSKNTGSFVELDVETEDNFILANDAEGTQQIMLTATVHNNRKME